MCCAVLSAPAQPPPEVRIRGAAWFPPSLTISADANLVKLGALPLNVQRVTRVF